MPGRNNNIDYSKLREYFSTHPIPVSSYTAPSDNTRVTNVTQRINARKQVRQAQQSFAQRKQQIQAAKRQAYRQRKAAESPLQIPMADDAVDAAIAAEERVANGPKFEQGSARPSIDTDRLASQYANMQSFYSALGSPYMMPMSSEQVRRNPGVASTQMQFGLDNPALTVLQIAAPTGPSTGVASAVGGAFRAGMSTAKPLVTRLATSTGRAVVAGGKQVAQNAPRVAASTAVNAVPLAAAAAPVAGDGSGSSDNSGLGWLSIPIGAALTYGGYRFGKSKGWWGKAASTKAKEATPYVYSHNRSLFTWERPASWEDRARRQANKDFKTKMAQEWNDAVSSGTTQAFKDKYGLSYMDDGKKIYFDDNIIADQIQMGRFNNDDVFGGHSLNFQNLPNWNNRVYIGPTDRQAGWAYARNTGRIATWLGAPVFGLSYYNSLSNGSSNSNADGGTKTKNRQTPTTQPKNQEQTAESDTTVAVPWGAPAPVTTSSQSQLDSINNQWRDQINN